MARSSRQLDSDLPQRVEYRTTMERLEAARHSRKDDVEYWFAREIQSIFGYESWAKFTPVLERVRASMTANSVDPSHHIVQTDKLVEIGGGAKRRTTDYFLSRASCYLVAMNGDPSKPEVAAAQAYFAVATRAREVDEALAHDEKRLELREKVTRSFKAVSGVAKEAGVQNNKQALFHDARYQGLYGTSAQGVKKTKGLQPNENPFDRMGALELSANDFQMNLAAETLRQERVKGESNAIRKNKEIAEKVRKTMIDSGSRPPEELPVDEPINQVRKRVKQHQKSLLSSAPKRLT